MDDSILLSIARLVGISDCDVENGVYTTDLLMHINTFISVLTQVGVGPPNGFFVTDANATWRDFLGDDTRYSMAFSFIYIKTKLIFDPPASSSVISAMNQEASELIWRLNFLSETKGGSP